ncbi:MAG: MalY/PatB family protein [Saccharospirillum sp.]
MFDFTDRRNTHAIKWEKYRSQGLLPMWVADMDLATAPCVAQALQQRIDHPVYGYTHPWPGLNQSVVHWCQQEYDWPIDPDWIVWMPGVVPSFNLAIAAFAQGGRVITQEPNYPPLRSAAKLRGCKPVALPVHYNGHTWQWDWQQLEAELAHPDCHLIITCNPMNPHGTVLSAADMDRLGALCEQHQVVLCSDEIHCDLRLDPDSQHTPAGRVGNLQARSITLMAASKTFNIAGLGCSFAIIPDNALRQHFRQCGQDLVPHPNFLGYIAAEAAFTEGRPWLTDLLCHLRRNQARVAKAINALSGLTYRPQAATFLAWIESDFGPGETLRYCNEAGIMPSDGQDFGDARAVRLNFGTDTATLDRALTQLHDYWRQNTPDVS